MENKSGGKDTDHGAADVSGIMAQRGAAAVNVKGIENNNTGKYIESDEGNHTVQSTTDVDEARDDNDPTNVRGVGDSGSRGFS